jgi:hypothetical protein
MALVRALAGLSQDQGEMKLAISFLEKIITPAPP